MPTRPDAPRVGQVVHRGAGRLRLRLPTLKGDGRGLEELERALRRCSLVTATRSNPLTGSVLVLHRGSSAEVEASIAQDVDLALVDEAYGPEQGLREVRDRLRGLDGALRRRTGGNVGLRSLAFTGLIAAGVAQTVRGAPLPAGLTLFIKAIELLNALDDTEPR